MDTTNNPIMPQEENRVRIALAEKETLLLRTLANHNLQHDALNILIIAYKDVNRLDLYAKSCNKHTYLHLAQYKICGRSGTLGPKKAEGDKQVPEGFYHIARFNPKSKFYLSLGINYPNELDRALQHTGSDIFIHGKCDSKGCLAIGDDNIKEIYLYALWAKKSGQSSIPVYIFPFEMTEENMQKYRPQFEEKTLAFWKNLQQGYRMFRQTKKEIRFHVESGTYLFTLS
ncbi:murein L,D-transpeptidase family protein [Sphingobacterium sp. T2]|uniref:L,D-transpeptidase family protein n=1 Tax=Sphingobacterium sp. T2 TaxID=1590596 RepID=UPI0006893868|nr:L,D-transpeptidase family protein [Sphingobacterium sp. T2]